MSSRLLSRWNGEARVYALPVRERPGCIRSGSVMRLRLLVCRVLPRLSAGRSPRRRLPAQAAREPDRRGPARRREGRTPRTARAATDSTAPAAWGLRWRAPGCGAPPTRPRSSTSSSNGIPGTSMMGAWSLSEREITQVTAYVRSLGRRPAEALPGDPARGRAIYARAGCATCHIVDGEGSGPRAGSHRRRPPARAAFLRESLLDPGAARPERVRAVRAVWLSGLRDRARAAARRGRGRRRARQRGLVHRAVARSAGAPALVSQGRSAIPAAPSPGRA